MVPMVSAQQQQLEKKLFGLSYMDAAPQKLVDGVIVYLCGHCGKVATMKCSRCEVVRYCNKECFTSAWKTHKKTCISLADRISVEFLNCALLGKADNIIKVLEDNKTVKNFTVDSICKDAGMSGTALMAAATKGHLSVVLALLKGRLQWISRISAMVAPL